MMGFLFGTACLVGLVGLRRGRRWHGGHGACGGHCAGGHGPGCGGHRRGGHGHRYGAWDEPPDDGRHDDEGPGGWVGGMALRRVFERLRTTPTQEREIQAAVAELMREARGTRKDWRDTREQVARAMRGEDFNVEILGAVFSQHDDVLERLRKDAVGALLRIHAALDERQREELARMMERGGFGPRWA